MIWLDDERGSGKKTDFGRDAFKSRPLSPERVYGKDDDALFGKTAGTSGLHEPCSSPHFVSHLVRKNCPKRVDLVCSPWGCGLPPERSPAFPFGSGSQPIGNSVVGAEAMFTKPASCRCLGLFASPPLAAASCQKAARHFFATVVQRDVCSGVRQARHCYARDRAPAS